MSDLRALAAQAATIADGLSYQSRRRVVNGVEVIQVPAQDAVKWVHSLVNISHALNDIADAQD